MYTATSMSSLGSSSSNHFLLDCFPAPPPTQHVSFPMSHLRHSHSGPDPLTPRSPLVSLPAPVAVAVAVAVAAPAPAIAIATATATGSSLESCFSSPVCALGLHITPPPYSPPAVISLGEEWTDDDTSSSSSSSSSSHRPSSLDVFGDSDSYFAFSPTESSSSLSPELTTQHLPLWQAEHARLLSIRDAVLSSERAARYREACLESEVARIKDDLARVKEARARARWVASRADASSRHSSDASQGGRSAPTPLVRRASDSDVAAHRRVAEQQQQQQYNSSWYSYNNDDHDDDHTTIDDHAPIPAESAGQFWDEDYPDPESVLANHLTEARSARAEERRKRKRDHERIRELGILLSLGSEVRQWEERLAWENAFRDNSNDNNAMELDHVEDPASRRRSKSLPITPSSTSASSSTPALSPPLPPLAASPLWRVSAEMILRRRSLSERPRRVNALITHDSEAPVGASASTSSAKPQAVPPPISITSSVVSSSLKSTPSRPSALKVSFTLQDLVAPEGAAVVVEKIEGDAREDEEMCNSSEESSEASDSDDSRCKSSSSNSSSSENENERDSENRLALRRGRSRWSWRRSLQSVQQLQLQLQFQQIAVDMEVDDA